CHCSTSGSLVLQAFIFSFPCAANHRHLPSFPTRRSSDLLLHHVYNPETLRAAYFSLKKEAAPGVDGETWRHYGEALGDNLQDLADRKSTRLNSSHVSISYAVFCLKKKKYRPL